MRDEENKTGKGLKLMIYLKELYVYIYPNHDIIGDNQWLQLWQVVAYPNLALLYHIAQAQSPNIDKYENNNLVYIIKVMFQTTQC